MISQQKWSTNFHDNFLPFTDLLLVSIQISMQNKQNLFKNNIFTVLSNNAFNVDWNSFEILAAGYEHKSSYILFSIFSKKKRCHDFFEVLIMLKNVFINFSLSIGDSAVLCKAIGSLQGISIFVRLFFIVDLFWLEVVLLYKFILSFSNYDVCISN